MYRRPKFLEVLHAIREEMSREVDYDVDLFAEMIDSGGRHLHGVHGTGGGASVLNGVERLNAHGNILNLLQSVKQEIVWLCREPETGDPRLQTCCKN